MREKKLYYIITFKETTQAMAMERKCLEENILGRLIPLPVKISAGCGLAWRMSETDYEMNKDKILGLGVLYESIVSLMM